MIYTLSNNGYISERNLLYLAGHSRMFSLLTEADFFDLITSKKGLGTSSESWELFRNRSLITNRGRNE